MHHNFGNPTVSIQMQIIENAKVNDILQETRKQLAEIVKNFKPYQLLEIETEELLILHT